MKILRAIKHIGNLGLRGKRVEAEDIGQSYTAVSSGYEEHFLKTMHVYNDQVVEAFLSYLAPGAQFFLDLACGTGYNSQQVSKSYQEGKFILVDLSEGMLAEAKKKAIPQAVYHQRDMLGFLKEQPDKSLDGVICCWAIKYQPPQEIIKEVYRVLKPQGVFGVIVNTKKTLVEMRKIYPRLLLHHLDKIQHIMFELPNPKNKKVFLKWFEKEGFQVLKSEEGKKVFKFESARELVHWVTHTGALAGFDCMLDLKSESMQQQLVKAFGDRGIDTITHDFVWAIVRKEGA